MGQMQVCNAEKGKSTDINRKTTSELKGEFLGSLTLFLRARIKESSNKLTTSFDQQETNLFSPKHKVSSGKRKSFLFKSNLRENMNNIGLIDTSINILSMMNSQEIAKYTNENLFMPMMMPFIYDINSTEDGQHAGSSGNVLQYTNLSPQFRHTMVMLDKINEVLGFTETGNEKTLRNKGTFNTVNTNAFKEYFNFLNQSNNLGQAYSVLNTTNTNQSNYYNETEKGKPMLSRINTIKSSRDVVSPMNIIEENVQFPKQPNKTKSSKSLRLRNDNYFSNNSPKQKLNQIKEFQFGDRDIQEENDIITYSNLLMPTADSARRTRNEEQGPKSVKHLSLKNKKMLYASRVRQICLQTGFRKTTKSKSKNKSKSKKKTIKETPKKGSTSNAENSLINFFKENINKVFNSTSKRNSFNFFNALASPQNLFKERYLNTTEFAIDVRNLIKEEVKDNLCSNRILSENGKVRINKEKDRERKLKTELNSTQLFRENVEKYLSVDTSYYSNSKISPRFKPKGQNMGKSKFTVETNQKETAVEEAKSPLKNHNNESKFSEVGKGDYILNTSPNNKNSNTLTFQRRLTQKSPENNKSENFANVKKGNFIIYL
jgi:hypothetical protein